MNQIDDNDQSMKHAIPSNNFINQAIPSIKQQWICENVFKTNELFLLVSCSSHSVILIWHIEDRFRKQLVPPSMIPAGLQETSHNNKRLVYIVVHFCYFRMLRKVSGVTRASLIPYGFQTICGLLRLPYFGLITFG